jgi:hypothetical protein
LAAALSRRQFSRCPDPSSSLAGRVDTTKITEIHYLSFKLADRYELQPMDLAGLSAGSHRLGVTAPFKPRFTL